MIQAGVTLAESRNDIGINIQYLDNAAGQFECLFDGLRDATGHFATHGDSVDHDFDIVFVFLVELGKLI